MVFSSDIKFQLLPNCVDGMHYKYVYHDVQVCIIKDRLPDMDKIKECTRIDASVIVKLEPENPYDNEAVALYTANNIHIGYLYRNRLKDIAYNYLTKGYPIKSKIVEFNGDDIYVDIAFYVPDSEIVLNKEESFSLMSRSKEMQETLEDIEEGDCITFDYDYIRDEKKWIFYRNDYEIGYAPKKYYDLLDSISSRCIQYQAEISEVTENENGRISVKIVLKYY